MVCLGLYVALFFSVSTGVSLSHAAWLSWCFGLYATWGFVSLLQVDDIWRRRRSWDRRLRFALLACFALAGFVCAIGAGKAKSFLFVFFSLLAYDMLVWILKGFFSFVLQRFTLQVWRLVLGALEEEDSAGMAAAFARARVFAEASKRPKKYFSFLFIISSTF